MLVGNGVNQLHRNAHPAALAKDGTLNYVGYAQLAADFRNT